MKTAIPYARSLAISLAILGAAGPAMAQDPSPPLPVRAIYANPTDRYPHDIMGRLPAHTDLVVDVEACAGCAREPVRIAARQPVSLVFEDFAPRLIDIDRDGRNEIVVVESHRTRGARLAVWDVVLVDGQPRLARGATTDFIGRRFRWLAPVGAADFDGDGSLDLAYVETPHLGKTLRIVRRDGATLRPIASVQGVTNHAIGQERVESRIELCSGVPVIVALDASGARIVSVRMVDGQAVRSDHGAVRQHHVLDADPLCAQGHGGLSPQP